MNTLAQAQDSDSNELDRIEPGARPVAPRGLRIMMIAPTPFFADRGCHVRILEEVRILEQLGHRVLVSTYHHGRDLDDVTTVRSVKVPWYSKLAPGPSIHKLYVDWFLVSSTLQAASHFRPDIVHGHLHEGIFVGQFVRRRYGTPLVADLQGSLAGEVTDHSRDHLQGFIRSIFGRAETWLTSVPDHILSSSTRFADVVRERYGRDDVTTIADAVDTERFSPGGGCEALRGELGIPDGKHLVAFLGVLTGYQGVDDLLEAARELLESRNDVHFLIMGYPSVEEYRERADSLGIAPHVTFTGRVDYERAGEYLGLGDIAVSAKLSKTEANGKLFNYMACGLPVVAYDSPINREILGDLGVYAELGNQSDLAAEINRLLDDDAERRRLGRDLRQRAIDHFSWGKAGRELVSVYQSLLARNGGRAGAR